jgi:hypothetical protein
VFSVTTRSLGALADTTLDLFAADGVTRIVSDNDSGDGRASALFYSASADATFYARAGSFGPGGTTLDTYTLAVRDLGVDGMEPDDTLTAAAPVSVDTTIDRVLYPLEDLDFMTFDATAGHRYVAQPFGLTSGLRLGLSAYDSRGLDLGADQNEPLYYYWGYYYGPRYPYPAFTAARSEPLFVRAAAVPVSNAYSYWYGYYENTNLPGAYSLKVRDLGPDDAYEPDGVMQAGTLLVPGHAQSHFLFPSGDADWYVLPSLSVTRYLTITVRNPSPNSPPALYASRATGTSYLSIRRRTSLWSWTDYAPHGTRRHYLHVTPGYYRAWNPLASGYRIGVSVHAREASRVRVTSIPDDARVGRMLTIGGWANGGPRQVLLMMNTGDGWRRVAWGRVAQGGSMAVSWWRPKEPGTVMLRVDAPETPRCYKGSSAPFFVRIRP